jgi:hypothetical protein
MAFLLVLNLLYLDATASLLRHVDVASTVKVSLEMKLGEFQRSLQRTSHDGWVTPNSEPLENSSWQVQY